MNNCQTSVISLLYTGSWVAQIYLEDLGVQEHKGVHKVRMLTDGNQALQVSELPVQCANHYATTTHRHSHTRVH